MRKKTFNILILVVSLVARFHSRPLQMDENNESEMEESEYEGEPGAGSDDSRAGEEAGLKNQEPSDQNRQHYLKMSGTTYLQRNDDRSVRTNPDAFPDYKLIKNNNVRDEKSGMKTSNDEFQTMSKDRLSNRYIENNDANDQQETAQHLTNRDVKSNALNNVLQDVPANKRTIEFRSAPNEEGEILFETNREPLSKVDQNEYNNNEALDSKQQLRYFKKYNPEQTEDRIIMYHNNHDSGRTYLNRNRRQALESQVDSVNLSNSQDVKEEIKNNINEDEETAIKRHIKKMSGEELEELLNSLSEDKKDLLKKIIDNTDTIDNGLDSINKREITKKAGAVGENSYIEGSQSDSSKIQEGNPSVDINTESPVTQNSESTENNKSTQSQRENNDISSSKSIETNGSENKADLSSPTDGTDQHKLDVSLNSCAPDVGSNKNQAEVVSSVQIPSKNENKRETKINESTDIDSEDMALDTNILESDLKDTQDSLNDQSYFCSQDEDLTQLLDDEALLHTDSSKTNKREIQEQTNVSDSIKSLEESFPNSEAYSDESGPHTGTLIRVKRKSSDQVIKKRSAAFLPDAKVPYFPYRAENDDEDNDEGNEFDDEGFYDPTSNFVKYNNNVEDLPMNGLAHSKQAKRDNTNFQANDINGPKLPRNGDDRMSLGSETDSVLSDEEGVDDNLMYSSELSNRRTSENSAGVVTEVKGNLPLNSASLLTNVAKAESDNYINAPNYQENDAFGPLPKNYHGDLGRYKRIRRVKQSHISEDEASSDS